MRSGEPTDVPPNFCTTRATQRMLPAPREEGEPRPRGYRLRLVGTEKRERQKELRTTRLEEARREAARQARRRRFINIAAVAAIIAVIVGVTTLLAGEDSSKKPAKDATTTTAKGGAVALVGPGPGASILGETPCPKADGSSERTTSFEKPPPTCIDPAKTYTATFETSKGNMTVALDATKAPKTVNNFVVLARYHFFDGQPFFRLVKDFAAQFGDPSESPSNSAQFGYTIPDELPQAGEYKVGSLAMANTGQPNSGGAQMFFITGEAGTQLPPSYSLFGRVTEGLDVLEKINSVKSINQTQDGSGTNDGAPTEQVTIEKVTVSES